MRLLRLGPAGREVPVVRLAAEPLGPDTPLGQVLDARPVTDDFHPEFFAGGGLDRLRAAVAAGGLPSYDGPAARIGPPLARPSAVVCIGQNYAAHAAETGDPPPTYPIVFFKHPNTLAGPYDAVPIPRWGSRTDWEVELGVVIGRRARYLPDRESAAACIAGYVLSNDVSERRFQTELSGGQWSKGKCCEGFQPLGPELVVDEIDDPQDLRLRSWVGGAARQDSTTADMIFPVAEIIRDLSQVMCLSPGDLVNTGTPQGVAMSGRFPYLEVGDVMEVEVDRLGRQRQRLVPAS